VKGKLRSVKNGGIGYGALRYLASESEDAEKLRRAPRAEVTFNYFGQIDNLLPESSPFAPAKESNGPSFDPDGLRSHLIELNVDVTGGCLRCHWIYSEKVHRRITVERMADSFLATLRSLIEGDESSVKAAYAPSDFAAARLDQEDLDRFLARISEAGQAE
jgi:non-ribosomal peptide synthase protein (TIGR01720 family)